MPATHFRNRLTILLLISTWTGGTPGNTIGQDSDKTGRIAADPERFFETEVRPILVSRCSECHSDTEPEAGLRLTSRAAILKGGKSGPAANAGSPDDSLLISALSHNAKLKMPPGGRIPASEIASIAKWIETGMPWPNETQVSGGTRVRFEITAADRQHWSLQPIRRPNIPHIRKRSWPQSAIDIFVLRHVEIANQQVQTPADRRTLIRRVYLDLVGVPPTWAETNEFVANPLPTAEALERIVDQLLASPQYGERWGRHWLDVARYADTKDGVLMYGDERIRPFAYTYRDYVIRAFNEDTPYDRFICEQLAGDLITPKVEPWRLAGLGFLTLGRMFDNNVHDIIDDQIDTATRGFLGLTVACARCHDHKYDPISTADYYSLYGVFASCETPIDLPLVQTPLPESADFEQEYSAKQHEILKFRDEQFALLKETARQRVGDYLAHVATTKPDPLETAIYFLSLAPEDLRPPIIARWRRFLAQPERATDPVFGVWYDLLANGEPDAELDAYRIAEVKSKWRLLPTGNSAGHIHARLKSALDNSDIKTRADVARLYADLFRTAYEESQSQSGGTTRGPTTSDANDRHISSNEHLLAIFDGAGSPLYFPRSQTRRYMSRKQTDEYGKMTKELDGLAVKSKTATPRAMVLRDLESAFESRVFVRGNPSQLGRPVPRQFLEVLGGEGRAPYGSGSGRLELAHSITDINNPLTARVIVNRIWMHHFGEPLVSTPSDFGTRSTPPQHLDLLNYLAERFIENRWSLKKLHRELLMSSAWQQSCLSAELGENVPLLAPRRQRLGFEAMRDSLLAIAGELDNRVGGRPVSLEDPQSRRRTVYGLVDRQSLPGVFRAFDFASPDQSIERRPRTMVPQQALFALNSPFMMEQAKALIASIESEDAASPQARVTQLFRRVHTREPTDDELAAAIEFIGPAPNTDSGLSLWEQLAQILLCSNELMYVD